MIKVLINNAGISIPNVIGGRQQQLRALVYGLARIIGKAKVIAD